MRYKHSTGNVKYFYKNAGTTPLPPLLAPGVKWLCEVLTGERDRKCDTDGKLKKIARIKLKNGQVAENGDMTSKKIESKYCLSFIRLQDIDSSTNFCTRCISR
jgi:hypothetical protein